MRVTNAGKGSLRRQLDNFIMQAYWNFNHNDCDCGTATVKVNSIEETYTTGRKYKNEGWSAGYWAAVDEVLHDLTLDGSIKDGFKIVDTLALRSGVPEDLCVAECFTQSDFAYVTVEFAGFLEKTDLSGKPAGERTFVLVVVLEMETDFCKFPTFVRDNYIRTPQAPRHDAAGYDGDRMTGVLTSWPVRGRTF